MDEAMNDVEYRVSMYPLDPSFKVVSVMLDEEQLRDLTSAMNYGSGWFRYRDGERVTWFNLKAMASVTAEPMK